MTTHTKFSAQPGAYERHLQRKYNNPLFSTADQHLLTQEVEQAREKDQQDLAAFFEAFQDTVQDAVELSDSVESEILLDLKEKLERLYVQSPTLAGNLAQHQEALQKLINVCMTGIRKGAEQDPAALKKINDEIIAREVFFELIENKMVADLLRGDEIIHESEMIPSILSESLESLTKVLELFDPKQQQHLIDLAKEFIDAQTDSVKHTSQCEASLAQMEFILANHN